MFKYRARKALHEICLIAKILGCILLVVLAVAIYGIVTSPDWERDDPVEVVAS